MQSPPSMATKTETCSCHTMFAKFICTGNLIVALVRNDDFPKQDRPFPLYLPNNTNGTIGIRQNVNNQAMIRDNYENRNPSLGKRTRGKAIVTT